MNLREYVRRVVWIRNDQGMRMNWDLYLDGFAMRGIYYRDDPNWSPGWRYAGGKPMTFEEAKTEAERCAGIELE